MLIRRDDGFHHPVPSEITPPHLYAQRRSFLTGLGAAGLLASGAGAWAQSAAVPRPGKLAPLASSVSAVAGAQATENITTYKSASTYNNFYEFGTDKADPAENAHTLKTRPWTVEIIPWVGFSLSELIKKAQPLGSAKYVEFITLADPKTMPYVGSRVLSWPYTEGLRMDEAMHPLTLLTFGMYGEVLPNQNGAPVRVTVPWKYGFKSGKSIVKIRFTEKQPLTAWNKAAANEYGFYSNVNPAVDHPRWSQATERRIGEGGLFAKKIKTQMFNGYEPQVGQLYAGMDLTKNF